MLCPRFSTVEGIAVGEVGDTNIDSRQQEEGMKLWKLRVFE